MHTSNAGREPTTIYTHRTPTQTLTRQLNSFQPPCLSFAKYVFVYEKKKFKSFVMIIIQVCIQETIFPRIIV